MVEGFDAIVIGTGQAGPALAVRFAGAGHRVAVIERKRFGGTCVNNGCVPTKTLIASARATHVARGAAQFGVVIDGPYESICSVSRRGRTRSSLSTSQTSSLRRCTGALAAR